MKNMKKVLLLCAMSISVVITGQEVKELDASLSKDEMLTRWDLERKMAYYILAAGRILHKETSKEIIYLAQSFNPENGESNMLRCSKTIEGNFDCQFSRFMGLFKASINNVAANSELLYNMLRQEHTYQEVYDLAYQESGSAQPEKGSPKRKENSSKEENNKESKLVVY